MEKIEELKYCLFSIVLSLLYTIAIKPAYGWIFVNLVFFWKCVYRAHSYALQKGGDVTIFTSMFQYSIIYYVMRCSQRFYNKTKSLTGNDFCWRLVVYMMKRGVFITNFFLLLISARSYYLESCDFLIITPANLACEL